MKRAMREGLMRDEDYEVGLLERGFIREEAH